MFTNNIHLDPDYQDFKRKVCTQMGEDLVADDASKQYLIELVNNNEELQKEHEEWLKQYETFLRHIYAEIVLTSKAADPIPFSLITLSSFCAYKAQQDKESFFKNVHNNIDELLDVIPED